MTLTRNNFLPLDPVTPGQGGGNPALKSQALTASSALPPTGDQTSVALGFGALANITTSPADSVAIGYLALNQTTTGVQNTALGSNAGKGVTTGNRNILLGYFAGAYEATNSDRFIVDNRDRTNAAGTLANALIYGIMGANPAAQSLVINAATNMLSLALGASPATTGFVRLPTGANLIMARNFANNANMTLLETDANDHLLIDSNNKGSFFGGSVLAQIFGPASKPTYGDYALAATMGDSATVSQLFLVKNLGNRGNIGNAGGSPLVRYAFSDVDAWTINKDGIVTHFCGLDADTRSIIGGGGGAPTTNRNAWLQFNAPSSVGFPGGAFVSLNRNNSEVWQYGIDSQTSSGAKTSSDDFYWYHSGSGYLAALSTTGRLAVTGGVSSPTGLGSGTGSTGVIPTATPTTILSGLSSGTYIVWCGFSGVCMSWVINIALDGSTNTPITFGSGTGALALTFSGANLQVTQSSGSNQTVTYSYTRLR